MTALLRPLAPPAKPADHAQTAAAACDGMSDRCIGDFIRHERRLSDAQVRQILDFQREHGIRFGEAAVALDLATNDDVLWALSQQFHYPYVAKTQARLSNELVTAINPFGHQAEAFRELRSQLMAGVLSGDTMRRALAIASPDAGDGRSYLAANLAVSFSQLGGRTLLVDADMRAPRQHRLFSTPDCSGLSSILAHRDKTELIHQISGLPNLYVLPVGVRPPNPLELLQRPAWPQLIKELLIRFDHVVVDTPAAARGADARVAAAACGAALIIGRRGRTRLSAVRQLVAALAKGPATLAGVLMNAH